VAGGRVRPRRWHLGPGVLARQADDRRQAPRPAG
jgi:hypothetical protein